MALKQRLNRLPHGLFWSLPYFFPFFFPQKNVFFFTVQRFILDCEERLVLVDEEEECGRLWYISEVDGMVQV